MTLRDMWLYFLMGVILGFEMCLLLSTTGCITTNTTDIVFIENVTADIHDIEQNNIINPD